MESLLGYIHTHQFATVAIIVIALAAVYFLLKNLVKLALVTVLILLLVGGYFYLTAPKKSPHDLRRAWDKVTTDATTVIQKGKTVIDKGRAIVGKGEKVSRDLDQAMKEGEEEETKKDSPPSPGRGKR